ncbi:MAG: type II toxin-antitoxin system prevent-host-death family antitoxin [Chloroflexi bacterium]|nr:type II toxin-antitoxin system prevent-host-death family antitoxin [Chloroflexota bacterium]
MATPAGTPGNPRTIKASVFKATCLKLMDEVAETGEEIIITKNGKPVAKLSPHPKRFGPPFGRDRDRLIFLGDVVSPIDVVWEAEQGLIDGE